MSVKWLKRELRDFTVMLSGYCACEMLNGSNDYGYRLLCGGTGLVLYLWARRHPKPKEVKNED